MREEDAMNPVNNATIIRRELMVRLAGLVRRGELVSGIDRIPMEMFPRTRESIRCCIHKDRAVIRYRLMALLGFDVETGEDEMTSLAEYARAALERDAAEGPVLTLLDEACSACITSRYFITNACRGCMARPCTLNCPRDAIRMEKGKAVIDTERCINCGICLKVCPYHAVVRVPVPCEEACPVGAISKGEDGLEKIDHDLCIHCGRCQQACPFGAVMEKSEMVNVATRLASGEAMTAVVAPAVAGQFGEDPLRVYAAIRKIGFSVIVEAAAGADRTIEKEYEEWTNRPENPEYPMATSCCPAWVSTAEKHVTNGMKAVSHAPSPMAEAAQEAKSRWKNRRTVFIGPCTAKRHEAAANPDIDHVLTFEELGALLVGAGIEVPECTPEPPDIAGSVKGRGFPVSGGVSGALRSLTGQSDDFAPVTVNGLDRKTVKLLESWINRQAPGNFIEVMACEGGCMGGPGAVAPLSLARKGLDGFLAATKKSGAQ